MDFKQFKEEVIRCAQERGITEYELYYQTAESTSAEAFQHEINAFSSALEGGVCFRCIVNGKMGYAATEELSAEQASDLVARAADNATVLESDDPVFLAEGGKTYEELNLKPYALPSTEALLACTLGTQEKLYAANPAVTDGSTTQVLRESLQIAICNSKGLDLHYENNLSAIVVGAVVTDGKEMGNDFSIKTGKLEDIDTTALTEKVAKSAVTKLGGDVAPTMVCPVVFAPEAMCSLLQTFSSIFSAENTQKGLSRLAGQEGQTIAAPVVTLVDDPFYPESPMPIPFDAEGYPTRKKNVLENGVLKTLLYNLKTAAVDGKVSTGNASKGSYAAPISVEPFTMYLAPGELSRDALLEKAGNGVLINELNGLHAGADPISGDFSLQSNGFLIENGKLTTPVKSFTVAGNFYELLKQITALSDRVELPMAVGTTTFGAPYTLVENLSIAGK